MMLVKDGGGGGGVPTFYDTVLSCALILSD